MAAQKPLQVDSNGRTKEVEAQQSSAGAGDAGKIVALDSTGRIDSSMMPVGVGADTASIIASENLAAGDFVNVWDNSGTQNVRKADASAAGKEADGFVLSTVTSGNSALVYFEGSNTQLSSLTKGARYYLSAATPGAPTTTPVTGSGNVLQYLGRAISATAIAFEGSEGIIRA